MAHSASLSFFTTLDPEPLTQLSTISSFSDVVSFFTFRSDGSLIAASDLSGLLQVFDVKTLTPLRRLKSHSRPVRFAKYPVVFDKLHLVSGGDDAVVKYWDVSGETVMEELVARRKLVTCVSNLGEDEMRLLLGCSYRSTRLCQGIHSSLLMGLTRKVLEMRAEYIRASHSLRSYARNLKRSSVLEEIRIQESLQEIQGIISPLLRVPWWEKMRL